MDDNTLRQQATELYENGLGYVKIAAKLGLSRSKVRRLLGKNTGEKTNMFTPWKIHTPVPLVSVIAPPETQMRVAIDDDTVADYAEAMAEGAEFPSISVFTNGINYFVADGFHRFHAAKAAHLPTILADIYKGTLRDAQMFAMGANANHGLRRTNADKRRAVEVALADDEWRELPNTEIAKMCGVAESFVRKIKAERAADEEKKESHNATPIETHGEPTAESEREGAAAKTPIFSPVEARENPEPPNLPQESGGHSEIWKYDFNSNNRRLSVILANNKDCVLKTLVFNSRDDLTKLISGLVSLLDLWD
jgi:hypothetical protein